MVKKEDSSAVYQELAMKFRELGFKANETNSGINIDLPISGGTCRVVLGDLEHAWPYGLFILEEIFKMGVNTGIRQNRDEIKKALGIKEEK